jgi:hypothetical protein
VKLKDRVSFFWFFLRSPYTRLVIGTSRTVGSAKKFVRITSGVGGGEFTKTIRKVCTCQKLKFSFLLLEYCKIRECYAVANAFTIRNMHSLFLYMKCNSRKINRPTKKRRKLWHSYISKLFLTKMQVNFSICFHHGSLSVIGDKFRFVRSKLKSR